ncbi:DUF6285 domain-containing protein [Glaciimonas sp. GG7]
MHKQVDGPELLKTARDALLQHLLPALPDALRYEARMIANAMLIASRDLALGPGTAQLELSLLRELLAHTELDKQISPPSEACAAHRRQLSAAIRAGQFDNVGEQQNALLIALTAITRSQLEISNPRALADVCSPP